MSRVPRCSESISELDVEVSLTASFLWERSACVWSQEIEAHLGAPGLDGGVWADNEVDIVWRHVDSGRVNSCASE